MINIVDFFLWFKEKRSLKVLWFHPLIPHGLRQHTARFLFRICAALHCGSIFGASGPHLGSIIEVSRVHVGTMLALCWALAQGDAGWAGGVTRSVRNFTQTQWKYQVIAFSLSIGKLILNDCDSMESMQFHAFDWECLWIPWFLSTSMEFMSHGSSRRGTSWDPWLMKHESQTLTHDSCSWLLTKSYESRIMLHGWEVRFRVMIYDAGAMKHDSWDVRDLWDA